MYIILIEIHEDAMLDFIFKIMINRPIFEIKAIKQIFFVRSKLRMNYYRSEKQKQNSMVTQRV